MIIINIDAVAKRVTFQFTDQEWQVLQWIRTRRSVEKFVEWLSVQFQAMARRKEEDLQADIKQAWRQADPAVQAQIKTLLGVT